MADEQPEAGWEFKPGDTVRPGDTSAPASAEAQTQAPASDLPLSGELPGTDYTAATPVTSLDPNSVAITQGAPQITWTASEYIDHTKSADWYLALAVVVVLAAAAAYLLFRDIITSAAIVVAGWAFGMYGRRRPRLLEYKLDTQGLSIADKFLPYNTFRSFAVIDEGHFSSIAFLPLKRFGLLTTVYYDPADEQPIVDIISQHLPLEPRSADAIDRFMKRIRF